ncbi:hypothetical protein QY895_10595 [Latilactobacillus sakei]
MLSLTKHQTKQPEPAAKKVTLSVYGPISEGNAALINHASVTIDDGETVLGRFKTANGPTRHACYLTVRLVLAPMSKELMACLNSIRGPRVVGSIGSTAFFQINRVVSIM